MKKNKDVIPNLYLTSASHFPGPPHPAELRASSVLVGPQSGRSDREETLVASAGLPMEDNESSEDGLPD